MTQTTQLVDKDTGTSITTVFHAFETNRAKNKHIRRDTEYHLKKPQLLEQKII